MITKAIVQGKVPGTSKYKVRIPIFDGVAAGEANTPDDLLPEATVCCLPNFTNVVNTGDIVFVAFEENDLGKPVILGHLYQDAPKTNTCADIQVRSLIVEDKVNSKVSSARLPENTNLGNIKTSDIQELILSKNNSK